MKFFGRTAEPKAPRCPSLSELRAMERERSMRRHTASLQADARRYGLDEDATDIWALARRVHAEQDRQRLPALQEEARRMGLSDRGSNTDVQWRIWKEQDRRKLLREFGFTDCLERNTGMKP